MIAYLGSIARGRSKYLANQPTNLLLSTTFLDQVPESNYDDSIRE